MTIRPPDQPDPNQPAIPLPSQNPQMGAEPPPQMGPDQGEGRREPPEPPELEPFGVHDPTDERDPQGDILRGIQEGAEGEAAP